MGESIGTLVEVTVKLAEAESTMQKTVEATQRSLIRSALVALTRLYLTE